MKNWNYFNPVQVHFGEGCFDALAGILRGRRALVLTYPEASQTDLPQRLERLAGKKLIGMMDDIPPLPEVDHLRDLYDFVHQELKRIEVIVAVGGGSVMDTGKVLATLPRERTFAGVLQAIESGEARDLSALPIVAAPTTAGTGSEVTPWATFWDRKAGRKYSLHSPRLFPEAALVDPLLTRTLPPGTTLAGALDALSHALEAIWNRNANAISDRLAVTAAKDVLHFLPERMKYPDQAWLRSELSKAALVAGLAFSNTQTALAHSISYPMTLRHGLPHGIACSFCLPLVLREAIGKDPERDAVLGRIFGMDLESAPGVLKGFLEDLGVSTDFSDYGVDRAEAEEILEEACGGPRGRNFLEAA